MQALHDSKHDGHLSLAASLTAALDDLGPDAPHPVVQHAAAAGWLVHPPSTPQAPQLMVVGGADDRSEAGRGAVGQPWEAVDCGTAESVLETKQWHIALNTTTGPALFICPLRATLCLLHTRGAHLSVTTFSAVVTHLRYVAKPWSVPLLPCCPCQLRAGPFHLQNGPLSHQAAGHKDSLQQYKHSQADLSRRIAAREKGRLADGVSWSRWTSGAHVQDL